MSSRIAILIAAMICSSSVRSPSFHMSSRIAILLAALFAASPALAQRMYKCVDDKGKVYYTQVPPKECIGKDTQEISRQGRVTKRTEAVLTPEQQAARDEEK